MKKTFLVAAALVVASTAGAQTTIGAPGGTIVNSFGHWATPTYGQTFTVPTNGDGQLNAFSFWLNPTAGMNVRAYVYAWDQATLRATGSALFESAITAAPSAGAGHQQFTMSTGGLSLGGGNMYVAFLTTSGIAGTGSTTWEYSQGDTYAGGQFVYHYDGDAWTTAGWTPNHMGAGRDVRFEMQFSAGQVSAVPEPATVALSATGLLALGGIGALRRRRAAQQA